MVLTCKSFFWVFTVPLDWLKMCHHILQRPADVINRKRPFAVWFPYMAIQRLWCQLEELIKLGHMVDQCKKLKELLQGALQRHLTLVSFVILLQLIMKWHLTLRLSMKVHTRILSIVHYFQLKVDSDDASAAV